MTISSLPKEKINILIAKINPGSSQTYFVVFNISGSIVKLLNNVSSIPFRAVSFLAD